VHERRRREITRLSKDGSKEKKKSARGASTKKPKNKTLRNLLELAGKKRPTLVIHYRTDDDLARVLVLAGPPGFSPFTYGPVNVTGRMVGTA
jgi:hypothetical protein